MSRYFIIKPYYFKYVHEIEKIIVHLMNLNKNDLYMIYKVDDLLDRLELFRISSNHHESVLIHNYMKSVQELLNAIEYAIISGDTDTISLDSYAGYLLSEKELFCYNTGRKTGRFTL